MSWRCPQTQLSEVQAEAMHTHKLLKQAHKIEDQLSTQVQQLQVSALEGAGGCITAVKATMYSFECGRIWLLMCMDCANSRRPRWRQLNRPSSRPRHARWEP